MRLRTNITSRIIILLGMLVAIIATSASAKVKVAISGGNDEIASFSENHLEYISLSELAIILDGTLSWERIGHEVKFKADSIEFIFVIG